jgi:hypothetical protein
MADNEFLEIVQQHERMWGQQMYAGRPALAEILSSPVVALWRVFGKDGKPDKRYVLTLHKDTSEIEGVMTKALLRLELGAPDRQFMHLYQNHQRLQIQSVKIVFGPPTSLLRGGGGR